MAILKHIASKNKLYSGAELYLCYEHDARTGKPLEDEKGRLVPRTNILKASLNCNFDTFAAECIETNCYFHKNRGQKDIKSHDYIISFSPEDKITPEEVLEFAKNFANRFLEGHQVMIVVHTDGHNHSGNIHAHIVANSVRKYPALNREWHEKACEYKKGCKHKCTNAMLRAAKQWVMEQCRIRGLHQVDLFSAKIREDYWVNRRGKEENPEFKSYKGDLRETIDDVVSYSSSLSDFVENMEMLYGIKVRVTNKTISFQSSSMNKPIRGKRLGDNYDKTALEQRILTGYRECKTAENQEKEKFVDSYIADDFALVAAEAIQEADLQLQQPREVGTWDEELRKYCKEHPNMDIDDVIEVFPEYYEKLLMEADKKEYKRKIITKSR